MNNRSGVVNTCIVVCLIAVSAGIFLWSDTPFDIDDAPITYRYAENIAMGNGFVYNRNERIQGTSTPLFTLLLASARRIGLSIPITSNAIGLAASLVVVALTLRAGYLLDESFVTSIVAGAFLLCQGSFVRYTMAGMETPLYTMFIMLALLSVTAKYYILGAVAASFAALTRLDGLAIVVVLWLALVYRQKRMPLAESLVIAALLGPWFAFALVYFGTALPLSMLAKQQHLISSGASRFWIWEWLIVAPWREGLYMLPFAGLGMIVAFRSKTEIAKWSPYVMWLLAYLLAYTLVGIAFYEWYLMPVYPILVLLVAAGAANLARTALRSLRRWTPQSSGLAVLVLLLWLLPPYARNAYSSVSGFKDYLQRVEGTRALVGQWLRENTPESSVIETGAIGHVGYVSNRYIIDSAGLVTPPSILSTRKPDLFVLYDVPDPRTCATVDEFETGWPVSPESIYVARCVRP